MNNLECLRREVIFKMLSCDVTQPLTLHAVMLTHAGLPVNRKKTLIGLNITTRCGEENKLRNASSRNVIAGKIILEESQSFLRP